MKINFYKILDVLSWIYIIFLTIIFVFEIISKFILSKFSCVVTYGDSWDIEHFNIHEIFCDNNYLFEKIDYMLIHKFFEFKFPFEFYFFVSSFLIFIFFVLNFIYDLIYIKRQKLVFTEIFKKVSPYSLLLNLSFLSYCFIMMFIESDFIFTFHF